MACSSASICGDAFAASLERFGFGERGDDGVMTDVASRRFAFRRSMEDGETD